MALVVVSSQMSNSLSACRPTREGGAARAMVPLEALQVYGGRGRDVQTWGW